MSVRIAERLVIAIHHVLSSEKVLSADLSGRITEILKNCYATGDVHSLNNFAGGLVGSENSGNIENSYATGNATTSESEPDDGINMKIILFTLIIIGAVLVIYLLVNKRKTE